jgi:hypothetical protein
MRRVLLVAASVLAPALAFAQGQIGPGHVMGNSTSAQRTPTDTALSPLFDQGFCAIDGQVVQRVGGTWVCATPTGAGTPTNIANTITALYTVASTDCGKTIEAGGAAFYTITVPAASGLTAACAFQITNKDTVRGKEISVNGLSGATCKAGGTTCLMLYPLQTVIVFNDGTNVWRLNPAQQRWKIPAGVSFNIDPALGNNANDGLASGAGAFATAQRAVDVITTQIDSLGNNTICQVTLAAGNYTGEFTQTVFPSLTSTSATWAAGVATYTTTSPHGFTGGFTLKITGFSPAGYNGIFVISSTPTTTTFTVPIAVDPGGAGSFAGTLNVAPGFSLPWVLFQSGWVGGCSIIFAGNQATTNIVVTNANVIQTQFGALSGPITFQGMNFSTVNNGTIVVHQVPGGLFFRAVTVASVPDGQALFKALVPAAFIQFNGTVTVGTASSAVSTQSFSQTIGGLIDYNGVSIVMKNNPQFAWTVANQTGGITTTGNAIFTDQNGKTKQTICATTTAASSTIASSTFLAPVGTNPPTCPGSGAVALTTLSRGMSVTGPGIAAGTTITACADSGPGTPCTGAGSLTLSAACANGVGSPTGSCGANSLIQFEIAHTQIVPQVATARTKEQANGLIDQGGNNPCNSLTSTYIPGTAQGATAIQHVTNTGGQCL